MTYVIAEPCIDVVDRACVEACPVDCIYEGSQALHTHRDEVRRLWSVRAGLPGGGDLLRGRRSGCLVGAHGRQRGVLGEPLPGAAVPLASPGVAAKLGPVGVDTSFVAGHPIQT
jgi:NAD-dependent dihydropyrimidine dehydrogenase PreA subunit